MQGEPLANVSIRRCPKKGVHYWEYAAAFACKDAGLTPAQAEAWILARITRPPNPPNEVETTVEKVYSGKAIRSEHCWPDEDRKLARKIIRREWAPVAELCEASPVRFDDGESHAQEIIRQLFSGDPWLCCGTSDSAFSTWRLPESRSLFDLKRHTPGDGRELLKHRFLCRQGGLLWVAPTGVGKSVAAAQAMCCWSRGQACMGIEPSGPLKSLYVQAENDDGDLAEIRDGVVKGLKWTEGECYAARESVIVVTETERAGMAFFLVLEKLIEKHRPDIVWVDPALSYLGGESSSQKDVGAWLRNGLNPLLHRYDCAAIVIHHTAKPSKTAEKQAWAAGDFAYAGLGSVEWANWARGVLAIRSIGSHETFELRAGKRGSRLGWKDANGEKVFAKMIAHSKEEDEQGNPIIYWREVTGDELETYQQPADKTPDDLLALVPDTKQGIDKATLMAKAQIAGIPDKKARNFLLVLLEEERLHPWEIKRKAARPAVHVSRYNQAAQEAMDK